MKNSRSWSLYEIIVRPEYLAQTDRTLADLYPGSAHVYLLGLHTSEDQSVRTFAADNGLVVVTKDADYSELHSLLGAPPKVIWIRRGNCSTSAIESMLREHMEEIELALSDENIGILSIY